MSPPETLATKPSVVPITKANRVAQPATRNVMLAPCMRRLNMSRPRLSVPKGCANDIGSQTSPTISLMP